MSEDYLVRIRPLYQVLGIGVSALGFLALALIVSDVETAIQKLGSEFLVAFSIPIALFSLLIAVSATLGRLPLWIVKRLPEDLVEKLKNPCSSDDLNIK